MWYYTLSIAVLVWLGGVVFWARVLAKREGKLIKGDDWIPVAFWPFIAASVLMWALCLPIMLLFAVPARIVGRLAMPKNLKEAEGMPPLLEDLKLMSKGWFKP